MAKRLGNTEDKAEKLKAEEALKSNLTQDAFLNAVTRMVQMNEQTRAINEKRRSLRKQIKAEGIELGALDAAIKMAEWERSEQREHFDLRRRYAEWLGLAVGTQPDMFEGLSDDHIQEKDWFASGRTAALTGKPSKPPANCPPKFHKAFMDGFAEASDAEFEAAAPTSAEMVADAKAAVAKKAAEKDSGAPKKARTNA